MIGCEPGAELREQVLIVQGEVSATNVLPLRSQGEALIASAKGDLVVDLQGLESAHSVVLSMLLCWHRLASERGFSLSFRGANEGLLSLAALSNLEDWLQSRP